MLFGVFSQVPFHGCHHTVAGLRAHLPAREPPALGLFLHRAHVQQVISVIVLDPLNNIPAARHLENT